MNPAVKVIVVSGESQPGKLANLTEEGVAFLLKPFSPEKLLATIHQALNPPGHEPEGWTV